MSLAQMLYQLLIRPLELIFEVVFGYSKNLWNNSGLSILALSLAINILLLPLYKRADAIQEQQRSLEKKLSPWVTHIKKTFRGDERFMMLQTYYRQNHYKPLSVLKGSLTLLLEIPFFIAAYNFLSHLKELKGQPFGPIKDLGAPDGLLTLFGLSINLLPILMTLINLISSSLYTRGLGSRDKIQLYGMAAVFLVLLYDSPAGLVFYWTLNNLFSLLKNLLGRLKNPKRILRYGLSLLGIALLLYTFFFYRNGSFSRRIFLAALSFLFQLPLLLFLLKEKLPPLKTGGEDKSSGGIFWCGSLTLTLLTGALIPSAVIDASPAEFVQLADFYSPLRHVLNALLLAAGLFLLWIGLYYLLAEIRIRRLISLGIWMISALALINYMFFGTGFGTLSAALKYDRPPAVAAGELLINVSVMLGGAVLLFLLWKKGPKLAKGLSAVLLLAVCGMSLMNVTGIGGRLPAIQAAAMQKAAAEKAAFPLSRQGKNVIVLMLDRSISAYLPYIFEEKPELKEQFEGFTYYPNTLSFGAHTNIGAPALFGGYEYTPEEMNKRDKELLRDKHNEALKVMPVLFDREGFSVTVCDPSYAGYSEIPDLSIYEDHPRIRTFLTESGQFSLLEGQDSISQINRLWSRNFFCYSLMKISPLFLQGTLYQSGSYFEPETASAISQKVTDLSQAKGSEMAFLNSLAALNALRDMTQIEEGSGNTFLMLANGVTHSPQILSEPDYEPADSIDNRAYDAAHQDRFTLGGVRLDIQNYTQMSHYHINMAALLKVGRWLDYLKEQGLYDNTRIIIAADHGYDLGVLSSMKYGEKREDDAMFYNPLLLVKDFDSRLLQKDERLMTNGDVPALAVQGLIQNPVNPFTGRLIQSPEKEGARFKVFCSHDWDVISNSGTVFLPGDWYEVQKDVRIAENWSFLDHH